MVFTPSFIVPAPSFPLSYRQTLGFDHFEIALAAESTGAIVTGDLLAEIVLIETGETEIETN
ncbi:MAG: hypothetical protein LC746_15820 [Acidobacteria bacterium]|nr:hypothetical protein [Acidobacteriota bacterium]